MKLRLQTMLNRQVVFAGLLKGFSSSRQRSHRYCYMDALHRR